MATIHDIAKRAQVSIATVSRVFNNRQDVQETTRNRVLEAARSLNYEPHSAARNLRRARNGRAELNYAIGVVFLSGRVFSAETFFVDLAAAVEYSLREQGFRLTVITASSEGNIPSEIRSGHVDGIICRGLGPVVRDFAKIIPTVTLDTYDPQSDAFGVVPDYRRGVFEATSRILRAGHRKIALLSGPPIKGDAFAFTSQVLDGCMDAYAEEGVEVPAGLTQYSAGTPQEGYEAGLKLLADPANRPDVIIVSDSIMLGVYRAVYEKGLRIPNDISLLGIDGLDVGQFYAPPLTTVDVNVFDLGNTAARVLVENVNERKRQRGMILKPVTVLERESVKF